jgi:hypothetical protein
MKQALVVIDNFVVTAVVQPQMEAMSVGTWLVLSGQYSDVAGLPDPGVSVVVRTPAGASHAASVVEVQVRHGNAALRLSPAGIDVPRLSTIEVAHEP